MQLVAENLFRNPSFEEASGEVVVRENLCPNPQAKVDLSGWNRGSGGVTARHSLDGHPGVKVTGTGSYVAPTAGSYPVGALISVSVLVAALNQDAVGKTIELQGHDGTGFFTTRVSVTLGLVGETVEAVCASVTTATSPRAYAYPIGFTGSEEWFITDALIQPVDSVGDSPGAYFDEDTVASDDRMYRPRTDGGAEEYVHSLAGFTDAYQSKVWAASGTHSLRVPSAGTGYTLIALPGTSADTYTVLATARFADQGCGFGGSVVWSDAPGQQLRTTLAGGSSCFFTSVWDTAHSSPESDGWWDDLLIVEGDYTGPYFDGDTPDTSTYKFAWTGAPNASTSTMSLVTADDFNLPPGENIRSTLSKYIWFGNQRVQQWLPMPSSGTQATSEYSVNGAALANGGFHSVRSSGFHKTYQFDFAVREANQWNGIEGYSRFASGIDSGRASTGGTGSGVSEGQLFRFCDPMVMGRNMFTPQWAAPQLCGEYGDAFHNISGKRGDTYVTPQNTRHYPGTAPYWDLSASGAPSATRQPDDRPRHTFKLLVPPTHMLYLGFVGVITGAGAIFVEKRFRDGTSGVETITELINPTSGDGLGSLMVDGSEVAYVTMWLGSTSPGDDAQVALVASTAIELPYWETPDMSTGGWWTEGLGHSGLEFGDGAFVETYEVAVQGGRGRYLKGMSTSLVEVGAWR